MYELAISDLLASTDGLVASRYIREQTLSRIDHFLSAPHLPVYPDLKGMCERVSDSYRDRVVLELLQNAHDAHATEPGDGRIAVVLDRHDGPFGSLCVANDGAPFTVCNFDALCSPTRTTKTVNEAIGNKGVGFLSAFQVCAHPQVFSRGSRSSPTLDGFCFSFADDHVLRSFLTECGKGAQAGPVIEKMPRLYLPCPLPDIPNSVRVLERQGYSTVVRLPLRSDEAYEAVARQAQELILEGPPVQLFLTRIADLSVIVDGRTRRLTRQTKLIARDEARKLSVITCDDRKFIVAQTTIPYARVIEVIRADIQANRLPDAWARWEGNAVVSIAVAADGPPLVGRTYNFLPMGEKAQPSFNGYLDAPFFASINRTEVQKGVTLNDLFSATARQMTLVAARLAKRHLTPKTGRRAVVDFLCWTGGAAAQVREELVDLREALVPTLLNGKPSGWARLEDLRLWMGDDVITANRASAVAAIALADPDLGPQRIAGLKAFAARKDGLACTAEERADVVEGLARRMLKRKPPITEWNRFYQSVTVLMRQEGDALAGREILLSARRELLAAERRETAAQPRKARRRLSAVFLPLLRGTDGDTGEPDLPRAVQRRLAFVAPELALARDRTNPVRRFFLAAGLVRDHDSREILRLLVNTMLDTGDVRDPEELRWEALSAMVRIVVKEDTADGVVAELNPPVPTRSGWVRAGQAYFSAQWTGVRSSGLQRLFDQAAGLSAELDEHAGRQLLPFADWKASGTKRDEWVMFLKKAGVVDHLRPITALTSPYPRLWPSSLPQAFVQRSGLTAHQAKALSSLIQERDALPNPQTLYTIRSATRLPGQLDHDLLVTAVGSLYAIQVIRAL